jgi:hypothetical protein
MYYVVENQLRVSGNLEKPIKTPIINGSLPDVLSLCGEYLIRGPDELRVCQ